MTPSYKAILPLLLLSLFFSGCFFSKDSLDSTLEDLKEKTNTALSEGKKQAGALSEDVTNIKNDITQKIQDIDQAMKEIQEAKNAIDRIFNTSAPEQMYFCATHSDCVVVDYSGCCTTKNALNKEYLEIYQEKSEWQKDTLDCSAITCESVSYSETARCESNANGIRTCLLVREPEEL